MKLKRTLLTIASVVATWTVCAPAMADLQLATAKNCMACHAVDKKLVGPAYKEVAAKYRGDGKAAAHLFNKIRHGGSGVWGEVPMIPHGADKISDDDLKAAVQWILALP